MFPFKKHAFLGIAITRIACTKDSKLLPNSSSYYKGLYEDKPNCLIQIKSIPARRPYLWYF
jgi:hypothetical protein